MAEVYETIELERDANEIWPLVSDFVGFLAAIGFPATDASDGGQTLRRVSSPDGDIVERLDHIDEAAREVSYSIVAPGPLPVLDYTAKIAVQSISDTACRVVWTSSFKTTTGDDASVSRTLGGMFRGGLEGLKATVQRAS